MAPKKTKEQYIEELKIKNPNIILAGDYINSHTPIKHRCKKHNVFFNTRPSDALRGSGCKFCRGERIRSTKVKSEDKYIEELSDKNPTLQYIGGYINTDTPILHRCLIHDINFKISPYSALQGHGCKFCRTERISSTQRKSESTYVSELKENNPNLELADTYINSNTSIKHYCKEHNVYFYTSPRVALQGSGCSQCWKEKLRNVRLKTQWQYIQELKEVQPKIILIGEYNGSSVPITHKCMVCGNQWDAAPASIVNAGTGCPKCSTSKGEKQVMNWLDSHCISYIAQKTFEDCRDKRKLPFDFYLTDYNTCIEYQGMQHYKPIEYFGGEDNLLYVQRHDMIKKDCCESNNIKLICISYLEDVNTILEQNLLI